MIKICALDFLKKETFDTDVMNANGDVLFSSEDKVTPEILLSLYFKNIYISEPLEIEIEETSVDIDESEEQEDIKLGFDEAQGARVAKNALEIAKILDWNEEECKDLEQAAYYHNIGSMDLTKEDLLAKDFRIRRAEAGYTYLFKTLELPDRIAEVSKLYINNYDPNNFELDKKNRSNIPFHHIVAIASFYDEFLMKTSSKKEALMKMLRLGSNKFNLFVLHKFINKMRNTND